MNFPFNQSKTKNYNLLNENYMRLNKKKKTLDEFNWKN